MSALQNRDVNAQITPQPASTDAKMNATSAADGMENNKQQKFIAESSNNSQSYVSPSDAILSPASKKLADFKQKQMNKQGSRKPAARTLFARTPSSCSSGGFDDIATAEKA